MRTRRQDPHILREEKKKEVRTALVLPFKLKVLDVLSQMREHGIVKL